MKNLQSDLDLLKQSNMNNKIRENEKSVEFVVCVQLNVEHQSLQSQKPYERMNVSSKACKRQFDSAGELVAADVYPPALGFMCTLSAHNRLLALWDRDDTIKQDEYENSPSSWFIRRLRAGHDGRLLHSLFPLCDRQADGLMH